MDGYLQTGIGIAVSILLFWLSYRQTIGAKKERTKNANKSVHRALIRRMVLEDYIPNYSDLSRLIEGKAREFNTNTNDMLSEEQVFNSIYTEIFDSDLIPHQQRVEIEKRLNALFTRIEEKPSQPTFVELKILKDQNRKKRDSLMLMTVSVSIIGALTSIMYGFLENPSSIVFDNSEWLLSGLMVFVASIAMLTLTSIVEKNKENSSTSNRRTAMISGIEFEIEVAKAIEKANYNYETEPKIGNYRPDFIIDDNNKKIAIEVKAWGETFSLSSMKRTLNRLNAMAEENGINSVILVTKKTPPIKGLNDANSSVKVYNFNEFTTTLKNKKIV